MNKKTFRITKKKLESIEKVLWQELARTTRGTRDVLKTTRILNMIDQVDNLKCDFSDWCEPEKEVQK